MLQDQVKMKISSFDLNLFVIMNSIYTEGSLTKAAEVVGITQPAVSNALSRLREKFDDELFVRTGSGMVPTQKTENIIRDIQNALQLMQKKTHFCCLSSTVISRKIRLEGPDENVGVHACEQINAGELIMAVSSDAVLHARSDFVPLARRKSAERTADA